MIQAVIADDEVLARQKLRQLLREEPEIDVVGESASGSETIELVRHTRPDLLFLDVRMPGMDGFDIVGALHAEPGITPPRVIFTTAYDNFALRAFEIHAVDYLLKPFTLERLRSAVGSARQQIQSLNAAPGRDETAKSNGDKFSRRIVFKSRGRILFLPLSEIRWVGAEENYVRICTQTETHLLRETMSRIEERLDPQMFLRVHRSSIVNLQFVKEVRTDADGECVVILVNGQKIAMSRSYRSRIQDWLHR
jgi:two-component system, LytTR family, response regulator